MQEDGESLSSVEDENNTNTEKADEIEETQSLMRSFAATSLLISKHTVKHMKCIMMMNESESAGKDEDARLSSLSSSAFWECIAYNDSSKGGHFAAQPIRAQYFLN